MTRLTRDRPTEARRAMAFGQELSGRYEVEVLDISDRGQLGECAPGVGG
ncbi:hypothetical protein [Mycobacterium europaeum]|nr:hypothetical protein [Mycobacterium europaeum]